MNNAKYDRQLRLWNGHGQQKLEEANILALGSGIEVAETLKNLVLPGLGGYVLVDDTVVSLGDLGNNFYLQPQDIGRHRALAVSAMINELNSVNGMSVVQSISEYIKSNDLSKYTLIVAADLLPEEVAFLKTFGIPLVCVWVNGFFGFMHLSINIHTVIETHPSTVFDYRFDSPWPELQEYRDSINLDSLSEMDYIHVPFPVFILKAMDSLNFAGPLDYEQQKKVKDMIKKMDLYQDNENIQEALKNVPRINSNVPFHILEILNHPMALTLDSSVSYRLTKSSDFWILVNSLGRYVSKYQQHPLTGILPDMKSDTEKFVNLTKLYKAKAEIDLRNFTSIVAETVQLLNRPMLELDLIRRFCKNSSSLFINSTYNAYELDPSNDSCYYMIFKASQLFRTTLGYTPGEKGHHADDLSKLLKLLPDEFSDAYSMHVSEFVRASNSKLHNTGALIGGVAAQEIVKVLTQQYIPINDFLIYNGIGSTTLTFKGT